MFNSTGKRRQQGVADNAYDQMTAEHDKGFNPKSHRCGKACPDSLSTSCRRHARPKQRRCLAMAAVFQLDSAPVPTPCLCTFAKGKDRLRRVSCATHRYALPSAYGAHRPAGHEELGHSRGGIKQGRWGSRVSHVRKPPPHRHTHSAVNGAPQERCQAAVLSERLGRIAGPPLAWSRPRTSTVSCGREGFTAQVCGDFSGVGMRVLRALPAGLAQRTCSPASTGGAQARPG